MMMLWWQGNRNAQLKTAADWPPPSYMVYYVISNMLDSFIIRRDIETIDASQFLVYLFLAL